MNALVWKYVPEQEVAAYLGRRGLTIDQAKANMLRRFPKMSEEKVIEELQVGPMCEELLGLMKKHIQANPHVLDEIQCPECGTTMRLTKDDMRLEAWSICDRCGVFTTEEVQ